VTNLQEFRRLRVPSPGLIICSTAIMMELAFKTISKLAVELSFPQVLAVVWAFLAQLKVLPRYNNL
jgi:hypothetical protein